MRHLGANAIGFLENHHRQIQHEVCYVSAAIKDELNTQVVECIDSLNNMYAIKRRELLNIGTD